MLEYLFTKTPLLFLVQDLWRDEAFSYVLAARSIPQILQLTAGDFNPPLYYILLHYWMNIFGSSEIAMRSLSLIFFLGTLYILYDICLYVLKIPHKRTAVYFLLFLFNPFLLTYAFEARMYMAVTFFVTLSYFALWTGRKKLYIAAISLGLYTHYLSIFIYAIQALSGLFAQWQQNRHQNFFQTLISIIRETWNGERRVQTGHAPSLLTTYIVPALLFLPWAIFMLMSHNFSDGGFWIITPPAWDFWYIPFILYTGYERVFGMYYHGKAGYTPSHTDLNAILWIIMLIPMMLVIYNKRNDLTNSVIPNLFRNLCSKMLKPNYAQLRWAQRVRHDNKHTAPILNSKTIDIILWAFFPPITIFLLAFIAQPLFLPRYYIFSSVGLLLLLVVCFENILFAGKKMTSYTLFTAAVLGIFLTSYTKTFNTLNLKYHSKRNIHSLYEEIKSLKRDTDLIYLDSELDYFLAQYYFGLQEKIYIYNKTHTGIPMYVGKVLIPADVVTQVLPSYPIRAFVVYYHWYNIRSIE